MVGCEHKGSPLSGAWPTAILKIGSYRSESQSSALGLAPIPDARRKARGKPELLLDAAQHKHARIRRELSAVEPDAQFLACN
jgi:hypothetical protein